MDETRNKLFSLLCGWGQTSFNIKLWSLFGMDESTWVATEHFLRTRFDEKLSAPQRS